MTIPLQFYHFMLVSIFTSAVAVTAQDGVSPPLFSPSYTPFQVSKHTYAPAQFATILSSLGFQELSTAISAANLSAITPLTIFAPSDASHLTCPSCSVSLLIREFSLPGLYPFRYLQTLVFGTKIETLTPNRCLTVSTDTRGKVFVNGLEITGRDLFNNGLVVIHGLQGYVTHLSPLSCSIESMTTLSFPPPLISSSATQDPLLSSMHLMLKDVIIRLSAAGYGAVSLALRVNYAYLSDLTAMTIFALNDSTIFFGEGTAYLWNFRYHVVPNKRSTATDLVSLPPMTMLPTLDTGNYLAVTTAGSGGPSARMTINNVKISTADLLHNSRIVIHELSSAFPHMHHYKFNDEKDSSAAQIQKSKCDLFDWHIGDCAVEDEVRSAMDVEDLHGQ